MTNDPVNKPKHYSESKIECISAIEAATGKGYEYYLQGNIIKYLWRYRNKTTIKYSVFKVSQKTRRLITRMYNIMLGYEDMPIGPSSKFYKNKSYTDKVYNKAIDDMINDKER